VSEGGAALGVADGVGEWGWRFGVNPRDFAAELMDGVRSAVEQPRAAGGADAGLEAVGERARAALSAGFEGVRAYGAAAALVATLDAGKAELGVACLGDSGLRLLRRSSASDKEGCPAQFQVVGRTAEQQHAFDQPFQLSRIPQPRDFARLRAQGKHALVQAAKRSGGRVSDAPGSADVYSFGVEPGDLVVAGSDGLFDNLHDAEICRTAEAVTVGAAAGAREGQAGGRLASPGEVARALAALAARRAGDDQAETPFSLHASSAGIQWRGGKPDDITVLAAWVVA